MKAIVTTGHGGYDMLQYRDVDVPAIGPGEVLVQVLSAGVNNSDLNTRLGWYGSSGWSDEELATIPCAYGTTENMLHRADVRADEHVLVPGASGGVGRQSCSLPNGVAPA